MQHVNTSFFIFLFFFFIMKLGRNFFFVLSEITEALSLKSLSMQMLWSKGVKYRNGAVLLSECLLLSLYKCSQIYSL